ncbi:MAG: hypothetical protein HY291_14715 [Planctomycetes bacterium]|nr:hypothetical protein [Planctomycetota bacterium]
MMNVSLPKCIGLGLVCFAAATLAGARDTVDGPRGVERVEDQIQGQGKNTSADRAYASWAQEDANLTNKANTDWMTVGDAIAYAKKTWNVRIIDETGDASVSKLRFFVVLGDTGKEYALPIWLDALTMAVQGARQDCYVERDEQIRDMRLTGNYWRPKVHIRKARPLQPDPATVLAAPAKKPEPAKKAEPAKKEEPAKKSGEAAPAAPETEPSVAATTAEPAKEQAKAE